MCKYLPIKCSVLSDLSILYRNNLTTVGFYYRLLITIPITSSFSDFRNVTKAWEQNDERESSTNKILIEMAPPNHKSNAKNSSAKSGNPKFTNGKAQDGKKKKKWVPEHKVFKGNVKEGKVFVLFLTL